MKADPRNRRNDDNRSGIDEEALVVAVTVVIIGGSIATGVTGSWLPGLATLGTLFMLGEFYRWYNSRKK
jgi:hypothetical protein